jgi:hypothetical protein
VIFALREPAVLLGILLGFVVGVALRAAAQRRVLEGRRRPNLRSVRPLGAAARLRPRAGWAAYLDPYGAVAAVLSGIGWGARPEGRRRGPSTDLLLLVVALVAHAVVAAVGLGLFVAAGGDAAAVGFVPVSDVLHGHITAGAFGRDVGLGILFVNVGCGLLALTPIPPLELGVLLWGWLPRSPGARRMAYRLLEEQWGVAAVLLLVLLPLGGSVPPLLAAVDALADPLLDLL